MQTGITDSFGSVVRYCADAVELTMRRQVVFTLSSSPPFLHRCTLCPVYGRCFRGASIVLGGGRRAGVDSDGIRLLERA